MLEDLEYTALREYCLKHIQETEEETGGNPNRFQCGQRERIEKVIKPQSLR